MFRINQNLIFILVFLKLNDPIHSLFCFYSIFSCFLETERQGHSRTCPKKQKGRLEYTRQIKKPFCTKRHWMKFKTNLGKSSRTKLNRSRWSSSPLPKQNVFISTGMSNINFPQKRKFYLYEKYSYEKCDIMNCQFANSTICQLFW